MISEKRIRKLSDREYRQEYLKGTVTGWVVHQLRALRAERGWSQADLAKRADIPQSAVGRCESEDYGNWTANTLLKLANAFEVALEIRFVSWPVFMRDTADTGEDKMRVPPFSPADFVVAPSIYQRFQSGTIEQTLPSAKSSRLGPATYTQAAERWMGLQ